MEALPVARAIQAQFEKEADVDIWNEGIFKVNQSYQRTLLDRASFYDFAIAVFNAQDEATVRGESVRVTRANVVFEFGLVLGRLGPERAFFILEEGTDLFSDWNGIMTATYRGRDNLTAAVGPACEQLRQAMDRAKRARIFTMLPSTSLAIGYYNNFLKRVIDEFVRSPEIEIIERDRSGKELNRIKYTITADSIPTIHIRLPRNLGDLEETMLRRKTGDYKQIVVSTTVRSYPFYFEGELSNDSKTLQLFDIPTTMLSSKRTIDAYFSQEFLAEKGVYRSLQDREIANFEKTLRLMIPDEFEAEYFKFSLIE